MKITIINGATATGKSTILGKICGLLPGRSAVLDGDDVGRCNLGESTNMSEGWLNVFQDNLVACTVNFLSLDLRHVVIGFVFPEQERYDRLNRLFNEEGLKPHWISLVLDDSHYCRRIGGEPKEGQDRTIFDRSVRRNRQITEMARLNGLPCMDASGMSVEEMCSAAASIIETSNQ